MILGGRKLEVAERLETPQVFYQGTFQAAIEHAVSLDAFLGQWVSSDSYDNQSNGYIKKVDLVGLTETPGLAALLKR